MKNKKIILSSILALGVLGGVVGLAHGPVGVDAATINSGTTLYFKPCQSWIDNLETWSGGQRYSAYFYTSSSNTWQSMTDSNHDGIWEVVSPSGSWTNVIFCAMNFNSSTNTWNDKWHQTQDLTYDGSKKLYRSTAENTNDKGPGQWETFEESYHLPGSWSAEDDWNLANNKMTDPNGDGIFEITKELSAGSYQFKVALNGGWDVSFGLANANSNSDTMTNVILNGYDNINFTASGGTYTFAYTPTTKGLTITHIPAVNPDEDVLDLFETYYGEGTYTKVTTLYTNELTNAEVEDYFHAGAQIKYRKTTYAPGELSMVTKATEEAAWGTHTSTYRDNGNGGVDHLTDGVKDYSVSGTYNDQDRSSVEDWYVTLYDFVDTELTGWEYADGVYTLSLKDNPVARKMAIEFVAPMWLDNDVTENYVTYDKLTVEEVDESLVMKLYVLSDSKGLLLEGSNLVLSQAVITK